MIVDGSLPIIHDVLFTLSWRMTGAFSSHRLAGELGALLDKGFFAQDLPKFPPNAENASELLTEAV
jgi:hypothetical protein